ncbi:MAG TPA: beta-galactosidase trimerization domain-containing protein [Verrucomicrobiae bacterium]|nr:beta-galactosidase trimerization domain-containing protein [Verrucomicrobiae bacterium]
MITKKKTTCCAGQNPPGIWPSTTITRRRFLQNSALAVGATFGAFDFDVHDALAAESSPPPSPDWVDRPMRWAQLTLVEDDPGKFDPQFWLDYFKRTKSDAVCLSAGGCVAYYPTNIPFHHRSAWLGDRDPFGELVAGCRKLGMVVIARTDPHATYDDAQQAHPNWIAVEADGKPRRHWASPEMWVTCALGPYNFDFMTQVKREIMSRYRVDGIFINRWDGSGMCYCEHCRENFKAATSHELPRTNDPQNPARRAYILWRQQRLFDLWQLWDREVRAINPNSCVIPNTGGGATSSLDMKRIGELAPILIADRQARRGLTASWANGKNAKEFRATMGRKPIVGIFSVGLEEPYRWKDSVQNAPEFQLWAADGMANGLRPWFTKFSGTLHDKRWLKPVEEMYRRYASWEKYLRNERPLARVGVVYSQQTGWFHGGNVEDHINGWYQALIEARVPFELVHDRLLDAEHLTAFKTLLLPNLAALSKAQCDQLRAFVKGGGSLIATHETSLYDEWGVKQPNFGLADLFGVDYAGRTEPRMQNAYLRCEHQATNHHPLLRGLEDAPRIIHGASRVEVTPREKFGPMPLTLIPSYPDLPMEKVYPRVPKTDIAQVFLREFGAGRVVYFPWDIDRTFWEVLCVDHFKLLRNAVGWATNEPPVVEVTGPGVLDVMVWRQKTSITVHLVNLTNTMMMKGPIREFIPVGEQHIRLRLPADAKPKRVHLLAAGKNLATKRDGEYLVAKVPSVLDHEVLAIEL